MVRQVVLDTETTGMPVESGHRIIEVGCVEMEGRRLTGRTFHRYLNPKREVDEGAFNVHGLSNEFLADKPLFADVADEFVEFIRGSELVIHNAAFDVGFLDNELKMLGRQVKAVTDVASVLDTLELARKLHPGQKNNLDALCKRYEIDNSHRELHGALLDAQILADVYLMMTGGQVKMALSVGSELDSDGEVMALKRVDADRPALKVVTASAEELEAHEVMLQRLDKNSDGSCLFRQLDSKN